MPTGNDPLKAAQIVTQRVSVEPSARRDAAEPIGRAFADLVDDARASQDAPASQKGTAGEQADPSQADQDEQFAFSALLPEEDDPSAFLVANAALSDTSQPVAGLLNLGPAASGEPASPGENAATLPAPPEHAAPTDILVDTSALFLPPDPNQPIETTAALHSTQFNSLSWPLPESISALQSLTAQGSIQTTRLGATLNASAELAPTATEGGPAANRHAANLAPASAITPTTAEVGPATSGTTSGANAQSGAATASTPAQSASQQIATPPPTLDVGAPASPNSPTPSTPLGAGAATTSQPSPTQAATAPTPPALASAPAATVQVYTRFIERFDGRAQQFQIRLDPPELGRVNVRIEIGADHRVHAVLATHDSNALADLLRGQRALEQSLADAGVDLSEDGIRFELSDDGAQQSAPGEHDDPAASDQTAATTALSEAAQDADESANPAARWSRSRINIVA